jgi:hypothetical protein
MWCWMMLGKVVGMIGAAWFPMDLKLHVHGLGAALLDGIIADTGSGAVIGHNRGSWLGMAISGRHVWMAHASLQL